MSVATTHRASLSLLQLELPGSPPVCAGVLLLDPVNNRLHVRMRRDWDDIAPEEAEVLGLLEGDLTAKSTDLGGARLMEVLEESLSNTLTITDPREVVVEDFDRSLARFYRENVPTSVRKYVTHIPRYSLAVAAGKFLENQEVTSWLEGHSRHVCRAHSRPVHGASDSGRQPLRFP